MNRNRFLSSSDKFELYMREQSPIYRQICEEKEAKEKSMTKNKSKRIKRGKRSL
tara:strand:+ start:969 stop:1130 length:162 start_codon:yes stop_codon:yes gene_type:complete